MKWELDDNSRSAFHYLLLGALVMAALAGLNASLDLFHQRIGPGGSFDHGYLIDDDGMRLLASDHTRGERLIIGLLAATLFTLTVTLMVGGVMRLLRSDIRGPMITTFRVMLLLSVAYTGYASVFLPVHLFVGYRDRQLIIWDRPSFAGAIPWPAMKSITLLPFGDVAAVRQVTEVLPNGKRRLIVECVMKNGDRALLGNTGIERASIPVDTVFANERVERLQELLFGR